MVLQCAVYQWFGFKSHRGKNKNWTFLKSNSNTVWFNFQTYIYEYIYMIEMLLILIINVLLRKVFLLEINVREYRRE